MDLRPPRIFFIALCAWAAYFVARLVIIDWLPVAGWPSYVEQDLAISVLRLGTLLFCLWLGRLAYDPDTWWGRPGRAGLAWALGLGLTAAFTLSWFARPMAPLQGFWGIRAMEVAINLLVAANEEFGWRGVMFLSLKDWKGGRWAVWGTAVLFTLMHVGYQPWAVMPRILFTGLALGYAREKGVSLWQLVMVHAAIDVSMAVYLPEGQASSWTLDIVSAALVAAAALVVWGMRKPGTEVVQGA
jgi:membrane protease YdiL (CAAX protease family)